VTYFHSPQNSMTDEKLLPLVEDSAPSTIPEVVTVMESIGNELANDDGLKWFNFLYLSVTKEILNRPPAAGWRSPAWLTRLDIVFAGFYFSAIADAVNSKARLASSWDALFQARNRRGVDRIQFAIAGMNAHINHDLSLALLQTNRELGIALDSNSPEHDDFEHVNDILEVVMPTVLTTLATGIIGAAIQDTGKIGQMLAFWSVRAARDLAWDFAGHLSTLDAPGREFAVFAQDKITGVLGRAVLIPI
jgi:hypothetical protein